MKDDLHYEIKDEAYFVVSFLDMGLEETLTLQSLHIHIVSNGLPLNVSEQDFETYMENEFPEFAFSYNKEALINFIGVCVLAWSTSPRLDRVLPGLREALTEMGLSFDGFNNAPFYLMTDYYSPN